MGRRDGRYPSEEPWCSLTHAESNPTASARRTRSRVSRYSRANVLGDPEGICPVNRPMPTWTATAEPYRPAAVPSNALVEPTTALGAEIFGLWRACSRKGAIGWPAVATSREPGAHEPQTP